MWNTCKLVGVLFYHVMARVQIWMRVFFLNKVAWSHIACNRKTSFGVLRFDEANTPVVSGLLFFELLGNRRCLAMEWM